MDYDEDDDLAFYGYVETTVDPGPYLLLATIAFCVVTNFALFWLIYSGIRCPCLSRLPTPLLESHQTEVVLEAIEEDDVNEEQGDAAADEDEQKNDACSDHSDHYHQDAAWDHFHFDFPRKKPRGRHRRGRTNHADVNKLIELELKSEQGEHATTRPVDDASQDLNVELVLETRKRKSQVPAPRELLEQILDVMEWDIDTKRILRLAIPFVSQSIGTGVAEALFMVVVGRLLGSRALSAFVVVNLLVDLSTKIVGGFHEALTSLCSHASGNKHQELMGQYFQISCFLYVILIIPIIIFWFFFMDKTLEWMDFDKETVQIGKAYSNILLIDIIFEGPIESVHALLDVIGCEKYSTVIGIFEEFLAVLVVFLVAFFYNPSLQVVGLIRFLIGLVVSGVNVGIIAWKGWFKPYTGGIFGSCAFKNVEAVKSMLKTGATLSVGYILTEGEWESLALFASFLGPAEVAAWGILGTLWDAFEMITESIGDAAEIRCAYLLGAGEPKRAEISAYKAILIAFFLSTFLTSMLFIAGDSLPSWVTDDAALQHIIVDVLPLFGLGNICLTVGQMCWTILGSQGRYRLATVNAFLGTCFVTLPLAAVFSVVLKLNLQGQTAAVVVGYTTSGAINAYIIFNSNWIALSDALVKQNEQEGMDFPEQATVHTGTSTESPPQSPPESPPNSPARDPPGALAGTMSVATGKLTGADAVTLV